MRLVYLSLSWVLGIYLGMRYEPPWIALAILLGTSLLFAILFHRKRTLLLAGLCLAILFGAILRFQSLPAGDPLEVYRGFYEIRGVVAADPEVKDSSTALRLEVEEIRLEEEWKHISGTVQVYAPKFPTALTESRDSPYYQYGDLLEIGGMLKTPNPPEEGEEFNFREYLARQGIYSVMYQPKGVKLVASGQKPKPMELIYNLRGSMSEALEKALPEPQCSLVKAIVLGQRSFIPSEVRDNFIRTGTAHLLAISGIHVGIVAGIALSAGILIFGRHRPYYFMLALAVVWLYVILSGMRASALRAATMGSLWLFADWIGRPRSAFTALTFAAAVMLAFDPQLLASAGFQLSFAAMAGLIFLTPLFQAWGKKIFVGQEKEASSIANFVIGSCAVTLGAILATLPLIAYYFHLIPLVSVPATFFTLPVIPGIIVTAALTGVVGILMPAVANILGWVSWLFVTYVLKAVDAFAAIPFASMKVEFEAPTVCAYYGILIAALWIPKNWKRISEGMSKIRARLGAVPRLASNIPAKWVILVLLLVAALVWTAVLTTPDKRLHIFVLDVGQGDSILIQKGAQQILVDGGPSAKRVTNQLGDKMPFWDRTIELVVLTHPDSDHLTGLVEVLQRYKVEKVLTSAQKTDSGTYSEWRESIKEKDIKCMVAEPRQVIAMRGDVKLKVLHPRKTLLDDTGSDVNNNSVVLRLTDSRFSCLLTGDIEKKAEECLLSQDVRLRSTVLKVAHHGSDTSTSPQFLSEVKPMIAVISVGADDRFRQPADEVVNRLEKSAGEDRLFSTSEDGTIELITDGQKLWVGRAWEGPHN